MSLPVRVEDSEVEEVSTWSASGRWSVFRETCGEVGRLLVEEGGCKCAEFLGILKKLCIDVCDKGRLRNGILLCLIRSGTNGLSVI